jgi:hypothetical protein
MIKISLKQPLSTIMSIRRKVEAKGKVAVEVVDAIRTNIKGKVRAKSVASQIMMQLAVGIGLILKL